MPNEPPEAAFILPDDDEPRKEDEQKKPQSAHGQADKTSAERLPHASSVPDLWGYRAASDTGGIMYINNNNALITSTNYWTSTYAKAGKCYFSVNAGCIRLLLSGKETPPLGDDVLGAAQYVIVTRGKYQGREGYEVLFEDYSSEPFVILTLANQWDRLIPRNESGRTDILFHVYRDGHLVRKMTARFRTAAMLPCLRPWE